ncbi:hypothetical protein PRZ48_002437 [Zasmidium cellare]|uniref:Uncharacterized protein n=1 Tax=Zasmidium cellare TaxID=395010 RepID=A0ABR0F5K6_ZASCE|nr:hypothetical protein PRZ48_002437 [Zasmidium cellare]
MDFSKYNKKSLAARKAGVANEKPAVPDAIRPKPTPSMPTPSLSSPRSSSTSNRTIAPAEAASPSKPNIKDSAIEHVRLLDAQIQSHKREITGCNNKIKRIQAELDSIPPALWGHHRPQRDRLEKGRQDCLKRIKAAKEGLLVKEKEKKQWQPRAKAEEKAKKAAEEAAKTEQKKKERSKKLKSYHDEFNIYTGTARSSPSHSAESEKKVLDMAKKSSSTLKRKRDDSHQQQDDNRPSKKVKGTPPSNGITAKGLAALGRIPKKSNSPAHEHVQATSAAKVQKRKRPADDEASEDMPAKRRNTTASKASPKPEVTPKPRKIAPKCTSRAKPNPDFEIFEEHGEELEAEVKLTMQDLLEETMDTSKTATGKVDCQSCKTARTVEPTKEISKYPASLVVSVDRSKSSTTVAMNLDGISVGENMYQVDAVVHKENDGRFVAFRWKAGAWWTLSDEDAKRVKAFQIQDHINGRWVLALLKQV